MNNSWLFVSYNSIPKYKLNQTCDGASVSIRSISHLIRDLQCKLWECKKHLWEQFYHKDPIVLQFELVEHTRILNRKQKITTIIILIMPFSNFKKSIYR